jgi:hypothetical protein
VKPCRRARGLATSVLKLAKRQSDQLHAQRVHPGPDEDPHPCAPRPTGTEPPLGPGLGAGGGALTVTVTPRVLGWFRVTVISAAVLLILATLLTDLGITFDQNLLLLQLDLKREGNVAVWYSSAILLLVAATALVIATRAPVDAP